MAMKVLREEHRDSERATALFVEEAQITSQLDHPNIVPVHELGVDTEDNLYFTMKLVEGKTLTIRGNAHSGRKSKQARTTILSEKVAPMLIPNYTEQRIRELRDRRNRPGRGGGGEVPAGTAQNEKQRQGEDRPDDDQQLAVQRAHGAFKSGIRSQNAGMEPYLGVYLKEQRRDSVWVPAVRRPTKAIPLPRTSAARGLQCPNLGPYYTDAAQPPEVDT
mgnify:CR=1 FL=1